jgi:hypothetical protein
MQAGRAIRAEIPHPARAADITGSRDPHACEGNAWLSRQSVNDRLENRVDGALAGDAHSEFLQSFEAHDREIVST